MAEAHVMDEDAPRDSAGQALRRAREAEGLGLGEISERTKIPERHLLAIEQGNFAALPARAYAVGFSRTYARAVGLNEAEIAAQVRSELDGATSEPNLRATTFEPGDPARIPSSRFAWLAAGLVLAMIAAGLVFWRSYYSPAAELPPIVADAPPAPVDSPVSATPLPAAGQEVTFTALQPKVWVKFTDAAGAQLFQKELAQGESFTLPATANGPMIDTARPDALAITVGGRPVPKLAERQGTVRGLPVSAAALLGRTPPAPRPTTLAPPVSRTAPRTAASPTAAVPPEPAPAMPAAAAPSPSAPASAASPTTP